MSRRVEWPMHYCAAELSCTAVLQSEAESICEVVANALLCAAELCCTAVLQSEAESIWEVVVASALHCSGQSAGEPEAPTLTFLLLQIGLETNGGALLIRIRFERQILTR